jgi:hypothetical protein
MSFTDLMLVASVFITILGATVQIRLKRRRVSQAEKGEIYLTWAFVFIIGIGGIWAFIGHTLFAERVAESIGWAAGNPFQQEVAFANLSIGILGLLSARIAGSFRIATLLSYGIFMFGAAVVHMWQIVTAHNLSANNTGMILLVDLLMPVLLFCLYIVTDRLKQSERHPSLSIS